MAYRGEWSEIYKFKTWDAREKIIGTHLMNRCIWKIRRAASGYLGDNLGVGYIKIEKVENSKDIKKNGQK